MVQNVNIADIRTAVQLWRTVRNSFELQILLVQLVLFATIFYYNSKAKMSEVSSSDKFSSLNVRDLKKIFTRTWRYC